MPAALAGSDKLCALTLNNVGLERNEYRIQNGGIRRKGTMSNPTKKPVEKKPTEAGPEKPANATPEEVLKPFHEASMKFVQANLSANESTMKQCLDFQQKVRKIEQETYDAVIEVTKRHLGKIGQQTAGSMEEWFAARMQLQLDYEKEVRQLYADSQTKLNDIAQKANSEDCPEAVKQLTNQRQDAYQAFLGDLQRAWSNITTLDPQSMRAITSHILGTLALNAY